MITRPFRFVGLAGLLTSALLGACTDAPSTVPKQSTRDLTTLGDRVDAGGPLWRTPSISGLRSLSTTAALDVSTLPSLAGVKIAYDMSHNTGRQALTSPTGGNGNSTLFADYRGRGATIDVITSFTAPVLSGYTVLWLEEDFNTALSATEKTVLADFVSGGGSVVMCCEDWAAFTDDPGSPLGVFGFGYASHTLEGSTTQITQHVATTGVSSVEFQGSVRSLNVPEEGTTLVRDAEGSYSGVAVRSFGAGHVTVLVDEICIDGTVDLADNRRLCNNLVSYSAGAQVVPSGEAATVTVTVNGSAVAGIDIPTGTFNEDVTVSARFVPPAAGARCHDYLLGQKGRCLEITAVRSNGEKATLLRDVTAGLCLAQEERLELFKFETPQGRALPLQQTGAPFLDCTGFLGSTAPTNWLQGLALGVAKHVGDWVMPKPLFAAHSGFGGVIRAATGLSTFTWASPIQISAAGLGVNSLNSGKDAFAVAGKFSTAAKTFDPFLNEAGFVPTRDAVTLAFGRSTFTVPASSFKYSLLLKRWVYAAKTTTGITGMEINPLDLSFTVAAIIPTEGPLPSGRPFSLQVGHRTQGTFLLCDATRVCRSQEP
jgi:hypothetical protein